MMNMKKILIILLAGILAAGCIACKKDTTDKSNEDSTPEKNISEEEEWNKTEEAEDPVQIEDGLEANSLETEAEENGDVLNEEEIVQKPIELNQTYITRFQEINAVTYPHFMFDYPENWQVSQEEVTTSTEMVTLTNEQGIEIKFAYIGGIGKNPGGLGRTMYRIDISKAADSSFIPGFVQATDHSDLGTFMVAKTKETGILNMDTDTGYTDIDGTVSYAVLPESRMGISEEQMGDNTIKLGFWYSGYVSFLCTSPERALTEAEEQEVIAVLSSFRGEY